MTLADEIAACRHCERHLPHEVRPVVGFSSTARLLIIGQAPGSKVHRSGIPWDDASGDRLREWTGLTKEQMYDTAKVALVPMGFCYPGKASGGDKPPRPECAPLWHDRILDLLPPDRLTLLVGTYAQKHYLPETRQWTLARRMERFREFARHEGGAGVAQPPVTPPRSASTRRRASSATDRRAPARRCSRARSPTGRTRASSA